MINHDAADSSTQKGSAGGMGQIAGGRESGSTGSFLGPPGRIGMITGAPSPHQVLFVTSFRNKVKVITLSTCKSLSIFMHSSSRNVYILKFC